MKKLVFIIPKVVYLMVLVGMFLLANVSLKAQVYGCHVVVGMSDRIFYTPYGAGSPTEWQTIVSGTVTTTGETGGYRSDGSAGYGCIADIGGACTVYQQYLMSDGVTIGMRPYRTGTYASIAHINCPIDDYIPVLFIFTLGFAFVKLKRAIPKS